MSGIPIGYCQCGCGRKTKSYTHNQKGKKGQPHPFYIGHHCVNTIDMFWNQIVKTDGCWLWQGKVNNKGYGTFHFNGFGYVHRLSYALHNNATKESMVGLGIMHSCDNPRCVNPNHLSLGTQKDNIADCVRKGRNCRGEKQGRSKLQSADVLFIREQIANKKQTPNDLGLLFNVHRDHINAIVSKRFWKHL